jgi:hypothetical protein
MHNQLGFLLRSVAFAGTAVLLLHAGGCASAPVTYKTRADAPTRAAALRYVAIAPLAIEVEEVVGGVTGRNDELTALVTKNLVTALQTNSALAAAPLNAELALTPARDELAAVKARLRTIRKNNALLYGLATQPYRLKHPPVTYNAGRIDLIADALHADAVLFFDVHHQCSTRGKPDARSALAVLAAAAAGASVMAPEASTTATAALVERDGTLLWFNQIGGSGVNLRTPKAAADWLEWLLAGLPPLPKPAPPR